MYDLCLVDQYTVIASGKYYDMLIFSNGYFYSLKAKISYTIKTTGDTRH